NGGNNQTATAGTAVATPPSVIARDASGNPVAGVAVTFAVAPGSGSVDPTSPVATGANGVAAARSWTGGPTAGSHTHTASAGGAGRGWEGGRTRPPTPPPRQASATPRSRGRWGATRSASARRASPARPRARSA